METPQSRDASSQILGYPLDQQGVPWLRCPGSEVRRESFLLAELWRLIGPESPTPPLAAGSCGLSGSLTDAHTYAAVVASVPLMFLFKRTCHASCFLCRAGSCLCLSATTDSNQKGSHHSGRPPSSSFEAPSSVRFLVTAEQ